MRDLVGLYPLPIGSQSDVIDPTKDIVLFAGHTPGVVIEPHHRFASTPDRRGISSIVTLLDVANAG